MKRHHLLPLLVLPLAGCVTVSESNPTPPVIQHPRQPVPPAGAMSVSPLTRIGVDTSGDPTIFLHLEFRDAMQRVVKAYGKVRVELYQSADGTPVEATTPQTLVRTWDDDFTDPVRNALAFDEMITRTYKINLGGPPEALVKWARKDGSGAGANAPTLIVQFLPAAATSTDQALRATYTLTR